METWWPGVNWEAAHPAVTLMSTWDLLVKQMPNYLGTSISVISLHKTWTVLLEDLPALDSNFMQATQCWFAGQQYLCFT